MSALPRGARVVEVEIADPAPTPEEVDAAFETIRRHLATQRAAACTNDPPPAVAPRRRLRTPRFAPPGWIR